MYNLKLITLAALLFVSQVLAGRIMYTTKVMNGGVDKKGTFERKAGLTILDEKDEEVTTLIGEWSKGEFKAHKNKTTNIIVVEPVVAASSKSEAVALNNKAQSIVMKNIAAAVKEDSAADSQ